MTTSLETDLRRASSPDPYNLQRFIQAQDNVYVAVCEELTRGRKSSHWMWFIFPQVRGLGRSSTAQVFAISGRGEAQAYLDHPILGPRLRHCTQLVNQVQGRYLRDIFGTPDDLKFHSSMTLFAQVGTNNALFQDALDKYCSGEPDPVTLKLLEKASSN
jgi:uncharacterized protein (DUF1810 family)